MALPRWELDALVSDPALQVIDKAYAILLHNKDSMVLRVRLAPGAALDLTAGPGGSMIAGDGRGTDFCLATCAAPSTFITHWTAANMYRLHRDGEARPIFRVSLLRFSPDDRVVQDVMLYENSAATAGTTLDTTDEEESSEAREMPPDCESAC
jgi:hypothetical protein